jgi:hypothetical protein
MTATESAPQPDRGPTSYITEVDYPSAAGEPLHHLFLPMRQPEPALEAHAELEPEAGL